MLFSVLSFLAVSSNYSHDGPCVQSDAEIGFLAFIKPTICPIATPPRIERNGKISTVYRGSGFSSVEKKPRRRKIIKAASITQRRAPKVRVRHSNQPPARPSSV